MFLLLHCCVDLVYYYFCFRWALAPVCQSLTCKAAFMTATQKIKPRKAKKRQRNQPFQFIVFYFISFHFISFRLISLIFRVVACSHICCCCYLLMLIRVATSTSNQSQNAEHTRVGPDWVLIVLFKFAKIKYSGAELEYLIS